ncbi:hypothetical protein FRC10_009729 [Ceratobasidium sp. 414]|nr:hypothetical protein FRC10_009729 [Ceratobasidium sp. 414]
MLPADNIDPFPFNDTYFQCPDFQFNTAGAGSSGNQDAMPGFAPHLLAAKDQPLLMLRDMDWWVKGLTVAEILSHKLSKQMAHDGGFKLSKEDLLLIEAFNYKVNTKISSKAFSKLPCAFHQRLNNLPSEDCICTCITALSGMEGILIHCKHVTLKFRTRKFQLPAAIFSAIFGVPMPAKFGT